MKLSVVSRALWLSVLVAGCPSPSMEVDAGAMDDAHASDAFSADAFTADAGAPDAVLGTDAFDPTLDAFALDAFDPAVDAFASDAFVSPMDDAFIAPDAFVPPDAFTVPDAFVPPDAFAPDAWMSTWPSDPCMQIERARTMTGAFSSALPITGAIVTAVTPAAPASTHGVFVQCPGAVGPALFIAIPAADRVAYPTPPTPGTRVSFEITTAVRTDGQHRVTGLRSWVAGAGTAIAAQEVSAVALPAMIEAYESELVSLRAVIAATRTTAGAGFAGYQITTTGVPAATPDLFLRMPTELADALSLVVGCQVTLPATPLWRFNANAQPHAWVAADIRVESCPVSVPAVTSAAAPSSTLLNVFFNLPMNAATLPLSAFTFTGGASATGVSVLGSTATLSMNTLSGRGSYTVTVAATARSTGGVFIDPAMRTAPFSITCPAPTHLILNELDYDMIGAGDAQEFIELYNPTSAPIDLSGYTVVLVNGFLFGTPPAMREYERVALSGVLAPGAYAVVTAPANSSGVFGVTLPAGVTRFAFSGSGTTDRIQNGGSAVSPVADAVVLMRGTTVVDALAYEGDVLSFLPPDPAMAPVTTLSESAQAGTTDDGATGSLVRRPNGCDRDMPGIDWSFAFPMSPGAAN